MQNNEEVTTSLEETNQGDFKYKSPVIAAEVAVNMADDGKNKLSIEERLVRIETHLKNSYNNF